MHVLYVCMYVCMYACRYICIPPHSASCNMCLFVCVHISVCTSAPRKISASANTILGTSIGVGCINQMQLTQGHSLNDLALVQAAFGCCILLLYILVPKIVFVCVHISKYTSEEKHHQCKLQRVMTTMSASGVFALVDGRKTPLAPHALVVITRCNLHWWCCPWSASTFINVCTNE